MGWLFSSYGWLSIVLQVLALVHYFRNRPEWYWFFLIVFFPPIGPIVYLFLEVLPGWNWRLPAIERFERRRRKKWLDKVVAESPTQDALSELAAIYAKEGDHERAAELYGQALDREPDELDSRFGRGVALAKCGRPAEAVEDLKAVVDRDPTFKLHQAALALAEAYEELGRDEEAAQAYQSILDRTTVSAAYYGLGKLQAKHGNIEEAKRLMQEILDKQSGLPRYLRRQERPWVWKARAFLKTA